jgi:hypothetical protein
LVFDNYQLNSHKLRGTKNRQKKPHLYTKMGLLSVWQIIVIMVFPVKGIRFTGDLGGKSCIKKHHSQHFFTHHP